MTAMAPSRSAASKLATSYDVPLLDVYLMSLNLHGLSTDVGHGRARMEVRFADDPATEWHVIVPTGQDRSDFELRHDTLLLSGQPVGTVRLVEHDDARLGYFRNRGHVITANTNRRSTCTGCVFCPNTMTDANDPRLYQEQQEIQALVMSLLADRDWPDLAPIQQVNLSTGCFGHETRALEHLRTLRRILDQHGFTGRLGILTSVIRSSAAMGELARLTPFALFLTLECLTRRNLLLKDTKASLTVDEALDVLERAHHCGVDTGVMLVIGLDPLPDVADWLSAAVPFLTDFPNLQVFQSHTGYMNLFRTPGADDIEFFLTARKRIEQVLLPTSLRPRHWQNYRPLWHYAFGPEPLPLR